MICPHCDYKDGYTWVGEEYLKFEGDKGAFFEFPLEMERSSDDYSFEVDKAEVYGCPYCLKTFINFY